MKKKDNRTPYKREGDGSPTSPVVKAMAGIAFNPKPTRMFLNKLDSQHNDDAAEAAAKAKRESRAAKVRARLGSPS
jgi:hypothetical protein